MTKFLRTHISLKLDGAMLVSLDGSRIVEAPMDSFRVPRKDWTMFVSVVANSDYVIEVLPGILIDDLER